MHTASKVDNERPIQMLVPDEGCMNTRAGCMIDTKVTKLLVSSEEVTLLLINHQFLLYMHHTNIKQQSHLHLSYNVTSHSLSSA